MVEYTKKIFTVNGKKCTVDIGDAINNLKIERIYKTSESSNIYCDIKCFCGKRKEHIILRHILEGHTKSCGCLHKTINGDSDTRLYKIFRGIVTRCTNKNRADSRNYVDKGISICEEWKNSFCKFKEWALKNGYNDTLTIDRINNALGYSPENCRWVTKKAQARNTSQNRKITINGETHILTEWAEITGINRYTISTRLQRGWTPEEALELKYRKRKSRWDK